MKRWSHAAYPNQHKLIENPTGEWVRWEDAEADRKRLQQTVSRLREELEFLKCDRYDSNWDMGSGV